MLVSLSLPWMSDSTPAIGSNFQDFLTTSSLFLLQLFHTFEKNVADDGERFRADLVERILRSVPVTVIRKIPDDIHRGHASLQEGIMVILGACTLIYKNGRVAQLGCGIPNEIDQCRRGTGFAQETGFAAADDIRQQKCFDLFDVAGGGKARGHLTTAVTAVGIAPALHGLFAIKEGDPDCELSFLRAEQTS